jgi:hypothetical protein
LDLSFADRPEVSTVKKWRRALEAAGCQFIDEDANGGIGVRLRQGIKLSTVKKKP